MKYYYQVEGQIRNNIGDVLQGMVAKAFLPSSCEVVDRESLADISTKERGFFIANGWYMHSFEKFPPPSNVVPLYLSIHVANSALLLKENVRKHFIDNSPIGCRDAKTLKLFLGYGIPAYYSGCLTTTSQSRSKSKTEQVILVDNVDHPVPVEVRQKLEKLLGTKLISISHDPTTKSEAFVDYVKDCEERMESLLKQYCEAKLVLTTKIHSALPCLGMGANVMLIHPDPSDPRLNTVNEFIRTVSYKEILACDVLPSPQVNFTAIEKRKKFLTGVVNESLKNNCNIIRYPNSWEYRVINLKSKFMALYYRAAVRTMYFLGIKKEHIGRVYNLR